MSMDLLEKKLQDAGLNLDSVSRSQASRAWGFTEDKARHVLVKLRSGSPAVAKASAPIGKPVKTECIEITEKEMKYELPRTRISTLEELIKQFKVDTSKWKVERFICNSWEVGAKIDGEIVTSPLYQVKATFVKKDGWDTESIKAEIEDLKARAKSGIKPAPFKVVKNDTGYCLCINVSDAHIGKHAWGTETGWEDWDTSIACFEYDRAVDTILSRCKFPVDKICYVVGNDISNSDNRAGTTTKGTLVDNDSRYFRVIKMIRNIVQKQIDKMRLIAPVTVIFVSGNHDENTVYHIGDSIECYYHSCKDVTVVNNPAPRKYFEYGVNGIMFEHGHLGKKEDKPLLMAVENPQLWARVKNREAMVGHLHSQDLYEKMGFRVRRISALCPADEYHARNGWVGNIRGGQGFVYSKTDGLVSTIEYQIISDK